MRAIHRWMEYVSTGDIESLRRAMHVLAGCAWFSGLVARKISSRPRLRRRILSDIRFVEEGRG
jgi:hypothetical protein